MRTILLSLAILTAVGCAGTQGSRLQATPSSSRAVPSVTDRPSLSERRKIQRELEDRQAFKSMTRVDGELTR